MEENGRAFTVEENGERSPSRSSSRSSWRSRWRKLEGYDVRPLRSSSSSESRSRDESQEPIQELPLPAPIGVPSDSGLRCKKFKTRLRETDARHPTTMACKEWLCQSCVQGLVEGWRDPEEAGPPRPTQSSHWQHTILQEAGRRLADRMWEDGHPKQMVKKEEE